MSRVEHPDDQDLRLRLRALRREAVPPRDLWPGVQGRLGPQPVEQPARSKRPHWRPLFSVAAALAMVVGSAGWWSIMQGPHSQRDPARAQVQAQAEGLARQYDAALLETRVAAGVPAPLQPAYEELDRNLEIIQQALARDPGSRLLLEQLHRTHKQRLALARRAAFS